MKYENLLSFAKIAKVKCVSIATFEGEFFFMYYCIKLQFRKKLKSKDVEFVV